MQIQQLIIYIIAGTVICRPVIVTIPTGALKTTAQETGRWWHIGWPKLANPFSEEARALAAKESLEFMSVEEIKTSLKGYYFWSGLGGLGMGYGAVSLNDPP